MKSQIDITEQNETNLKRFSTLLAINDIKLRNKEQLINKAIEVLDVLTNGLDEESLQAVTGLKKTW